MLRTDRQNLRGSWTRTFSFPEYREMAPVLFYSYQEALETVGNPELRPTDIRNYDVRWEWFPSGHEVVAASPDASRRSRDLGAEASFDRREQARRYRLGPGRGGSSPGMPVSAPITELGMLRSVSFLTKSS